MICTARLTQREKPLVRGLFLESMLRRVSLRVTPAMSASARQLPTRRALAKKAQKTPVATAQPSTAPVQEDPTIVRGLNVLKGSEVVKVRPDHEYPDWVWTLHKPLPTFEELQRKYESDPDTMTDADTVRLIRQWNRKRIRERNAETKKK